MKKFRQPNLPDCVWPSHLKVLFAVMELHQTHGTVGMRAVQRRLKLKSPAYVKMAFEALRQHGLITYEDRKHGTVMPACRLEMLPGVAADEVQDQDHDQDEH